MTRYASATEITGVTVEFDDGRRVTLQDMYCHCRPERVEDLLDDLVVLSEDVADRRRPENRGLSLARGQQHQ
jgi:hypothetical protein